MKNYDVKPAGFIIGTSSSPIITSPVNYYAEITDIRYVNPGTVLANGYLYETVGGTVVGTVDAFIVPAGGELNIHSGDKPVSKLNAGRTLTGAVNAGSIVGMLVYTLREGRS